MVRKRDNQSDGSISEGAAWPLTTQERESIQHVNVSLGIGNYCKIVVSNCGRKGKLTLFIYLFDWHSRHTSVTGFKAQITELGGQDRLDYREVRTQNTDLRRVAGH